MRLTARRAGCLGLLAALLIGPTSARAKADACDNPTPPPGARTATAYEVAEWAVLWGKPQPRSRKATATLVGQIEAGSAICPANAGMTPCDLTILASNDVSLTTGRGPAEGKFFVVQQDSSPDGPELIVLEGRLVKTVVNLAPAFFASTPVGYLCGEWETTGAPGPRRRGKITGMFQLPFAIPELMIPPSYVVDPTYFNPLNYDLCCEPIDVPGEQSLGQYTVRLKAYVE